MKTTIPVILFSPPGSLNAESVSVQAQDILSELECQGLTDIYCLPETKSKAQALQSSAKKTRLRLIFPANSGKKAILEIYRLIQKKFRTDSAVFISAKPFFHGSFRLLWKFHKKRGAVVTAGLRLAPRSWEGERVVLDESYRISTTAPSMDGYSWTGALAASRKAGADAILRWMRKPLSTPPWENIQGLPMAGKTAREIYRTPHHLMREASPCGARRKAVFLDRDGVVNRDTGYVFKARDVRFMPGLFSFCRAARKKGYDLVIATNQAGVGKGFYSTGDVERLHNWIRKEFKRRGVEILDFFFCPFHEKAVRAAYRRASVFRKPGAGMVLAAATLWNIDLEKSIFIGDRVSDRIRLPYLRSVLIRGRDLKKGYDFPTFVPIAKELA